MIYWQSCIQQSLLQPPPTQLSVITKTKSSYVYWQKLFPNFPKTFRFTLGAKIDALYLSLLENLFIAEYIRKEKRIAYITQALTMCDLLKSFIQISWENKHLKEQQCILLSEGLVEINKMLFRWKQYIEKTPQK